MTIEMLKAETTRLTRLERLEFLQFIAALLASEEEVEPLSETQKKTLLGRQDEIKTGKVEPYLPKPSKLILSENMAYKLEFHPEAEAELEEAIDK